jgi:hypothetical protein
VLTSDSEKYSSGFALVSTFLDLGRSSKLDLRSIRVGVPPKVTTSNFTQKLIELYNYWSKLKSDLQNDH